MAKRSKRQVWERTLWAIQLDNKRWLLSPIEPLRTGTATKQLLLCSARRVAEFYAAAYGGGAKPVKVRERIEVLK